MSENVKAAACIVGGPALGIFLASGNIVLALIVAGVLLFIVVLAGVAIRGYDRAALVQKHIFDELLDQGTQMKNEEGVLWTKDMQVDPDTGAWVKPKA